MDKSSSSEPLTVEVAEALYRLGQLAPEDMPAVAIRAIEDGFGGPALAELATLDNPTMREVGERFEWALKEAGRAPISRSRACVRIATEIAASISSGETDPYVGARRIWWDLWEGCGRPSELTPFVGLAAQYEDDSFHRHDYLAEIRKEAEKLVARQKLQVE